MTYFFLDATDELFQAAGCLSYGACIYQLKIAHPLKVRLYISIFRNQVISIMPFLPQFMGMRRWFHPKLSQFQYFNHAWNIQDSKLNFPLMKSPKHCQMNAGLVELVETPVKSESSRASDRPVYLVGESVGACIALAVAVRNPDIDLVLILVNPGLAASDYGFLCSSNLSVVTFSRTHGICLILQEHHSISHSCKLSQPSWILSLNPSIWPLHNC